jgi:hypothetical protein
MSTGDVTSALCPKPKFGDFSQKLHSESNGIFPNRQHPPTFSAMYKQNLNIKLDLKMQINNH